MTDEMKLRKRASLKCAGECLILKYKYIQNPWLTYRIVSNKRSPSNKRPLTYFQIKLGKMPKFLYSVS